MWFRFLKEAISIKFFHKGILQEISIFLFIFVRSMNSFDDQIFSFYIIFQMKWIRIECNYLPIIIQDNSLNIWCEKDVIIIELNLSTVGQNIEICQRHVRLGIFRGILNDYRFRACLRLNETSDFI